MTVDGRGREHGAVTVFKFVVENQEDDFSKSEVGCCATMFSQEFIVSKTTLWWLNLF